MHRYRIIRLLVISINIAAIACSTGPSSQKGNSSVSGKLKPNSDDEKREKSKDNERSEESREADSNKGTPTNAEKFFCENAQAYLTNAETTDYSQQLAVLCNGNNPTAEFMEAFSYAYGGEGEPKGKVIDVATNSMYYTRLRYVFALKAPFNTPSDIFATQPHDAFAQGVRTGDSELYTMINSRVDWPQNSSAVQRVVQTYDLQLAKGAGIYDVRQTESNIYMLSDTRKDVALVTERLLNPENNPYWHDQKVLLVAISPFTNTTFIVGSLEFVVKNRFDVVRFKQTMDDLNIATFRILGQYLKTKATNGQPEISQ